MPSSIHKAKMSCNCQSEYPPLISVGRLQRSNPLQAGTYWIDVIDGDNQEEFAKWTLENSGRVKVLKTEHFEAVSWPDCPITEGDCSPSRDWVKFSILEPVSWDAVQFGFPNIIEVGETVETSADTATTPDFSDNCDIGCQAEKVAVAGAVILGGVAVILLIQSIRK